MDTTIALLNGYLGPVGRSEISQIYTLHKRKKIHSMFIVFLYEYLVVLLCFYWLNNTVAVISLYWPHVNGCTLCWPFGQYSSLILI